MSDDDSTQIRAVPRRPVARPAEPTCVVVLTGRSIGRVYVLEPGTRVLGRGAECDLVLDDDGVSRAHCELSEDAGRWSIRDLGSTNGTFLGTRRVDADPVELREGDRIRIGAELMLKFGAQDEIERHFLDQLYRSATRDALTGLANRRLFHEQLASEVAWHRRHLRPLSLLFIDLDHFKVVNDTQGHVVGDRVLAAVAEVVAGEIRAEDHAARYGGEEFVVLLRQTDAHEARGIAERLRAAVEVRPLPVRVTVSVGVATRSGEALRDGDELVQEADDWLYEAKRLGRNLVAGPGPM